MSSATRWDFETAGAPIELPRRVGYTMRDARYRRARWRLRGATVSFMVRTGLRQLNAHYSHNGDPVAARDAVGALELVQATLAADTRGLYDPANAFEWVTLDDDDLKKAAELALRILEREWTPEYIDTASLAGRISKRPPTYTPSAYLDVAHLTQRKAADMLGCSISTIKRLARLARAVGGATKAAALTWATRVRRLYPDSMGRGQITRDRAPTGYYRIIEYGPLVGAHGPP